MGIELALLFLIFVLIFLIIEIATVMFKLTGLDRDTAQFQAVPIISADGYTTVESELITGHPVRRKIAMALMISGPIALAFVISIIVSILNVGLGGIKDILLFGVILLLLFFFLRNPRFITFFEGYLEKNLEKRSDFCQLSEEALFNFDEYTVSEVVLTSEDAPLSNRTLKETRLQDCGIIVLSINRNGNVTHTPRGDDILLPGDTLLLYGRATQIKMYTEPAANQA